MTPAIVTITILIALGIFLILLEIVIPGGVVGSLGALCLIGAIIYTFATQGAGAGLAVGAGSTVFFGVAFWFWLKYLHKLPLAKQMFLQEDGSDWHGTDAKNKDLLGREGVAQTTLRPSGFATIDDERVDVVTQGEMVPAGEAVKVIEVEGNRIVVAAADSPAAQAVSSFDPDETQDGIDDEAAAQQISATKQTTDNGGE